MAYTTPKVTIDLAEYNDLLEIKDNSNKDENGVMLKKVIVALVKSKGNFEQAQLILNKEGIHFIYNQNYGIGPSGITIENIKVTKLK